MSSTPSKWLMKRWEAFFLALEAMSAAAEIEALCLAEIAAWRQRPGVKQESSLRVPMTDTRNRIKEVVHNQEKQALALKYMSFGEDWYRQHNAPSRAALEDRLEHQQLLRDPDGIVDKAISLLGSERWEEIALGLAVCTGRRPGEILKTAVFQPKTAYSVLFSGQLKRRGTEMAAYEIPTLCEASLALFALNRLRQLVPASDQDVRTVTQQRSPILQEAANKHFVDLVPVREGKADLYGHLFRSVYARIAVFWYCPPSIADVHFMATIQGHTEFFEEQTEEARRSYASNAHYFDYKIADRNGNIDGRQGVKLGTRDVELLEVFKPKPRKEKTMATTTETQEKKAQGKNFPITVKKPAYDRVLALRAKLGHRISDETITFLLDGYEQGGQGTQVDLEHVSPEQLVSAETATMIKEAMSISGEDSFMTFLAEALTKEAKFRLSLSKRHADKDFTKLTTSELARTKHPEATKERIRRAIVAIVKYNEQALSQNDRWYINATAVHKLVGGRFPIINEYLAEHQVDIDNENQEYELTPAYNRKAKGIETYITVPETV